MTKKKISRPAHSAPKKAEEEKGGTRGGRREFDNTNRGALFQNDKAGNEKRPDLTGIVDLEIPEGCKPGDVVKFRVAAWERESERSGNQYLSLTIQKADKQGGNKKGSDEGDDD
jgi:hypothetical protein